MEKTDIETTLGTVRIADEVVEVIAGMSGGLVGDIAQMLGRGKNLAKGVKVEVGEQEAVVNLYLVVEYGVSIPEVSIKVQEAVKEAIESMTGLRVVETNVHIQGVNFRPAPEIKDEEVARIK